MLSASLTLGWGGGWLRSGQENLSKLENNQRQGTCAGFLCTNHFGVHTQPCISGWG